MTERWFDFRGITLEKIREYPVVVEKLLSAACDKIVSIQDNRSYENTVRPMINVYTEIETVINCLEYVQNFYTDEKMREEAADILALVRNHLIDCEMRRDIYNIFCNYQNTEYQLESSNLTQEENRFFQHELRDFKRNGLHLDEDKFKRAKEIKKQISEMCITFEKNINDDSTYFDFNGEQLLGMPDYWMNDPEKMCDSINKIYRVTLKYPDYIPAMDYVVSQDVRKKLYMAFQSRCYRENSELLDNIVALRDELAKLLGYTNHADYVTEINIVKNSKTAIDFLNEMHAKIQPFYHRDMQQLLEFAQKHDRYPLLKDKFDLWDIRFYSRLFQEFHCDCDKNEIRKYFPLDVVINGAFDIYQRMLNVKFQQIDSANKWHDDVTIYQVSDCETQETLGYFYLDLYPRDGKYGHAAVFPFMTGCEIDKMRRPHIITMACNFPKSGCIPFDDVETFFHEFGHLMHQMCSRPQLKFFAGLNVETDFVEALSQFLEYWCYCEKSLTIMSRHEITCEKIPHNIIRKLNANKRCLSSIHYMRQLLYGMFDLNLHTQRTDSARNTWLDLEKYLYGTYHINFMTDDNYAPYASFSHITGGYDAGYYGYLLTDTFAANMFYRRFGVDNVLDAKRGYQYRKQLLEPGATRDGMELLQRYLGSQPDIEDFLKDRGFQ